MKKLICALITCSNLIWCIGSMSNTVQAVEIAQGICGESCTWSLDADGVLTISGSGKMENYKDFHNPWRDNSYYVEKIVVEEGITEIGKNAFCCLTDVIEISFPTSLTVINNNACMRLAITELDCPENLIEIGDSSFYGCNDLETVHLNEGLQYIRAEAFEVPGTDRLQSLYIPPSVIEVGEMAFGYIAAKIPEAVIIPDKNRTIIGYEGTAAEAYANSVGLQFESLGNLCGDMNGDKIVDVFDLAMIKRYVTSPQKSSIDFSRVDLNKDGMVDVDDIVMLNDFLHGKRTVLSEEN